jgi:hypothetical protein
MVCSYYNQVRQISIHNHLNYYSKNGRDHKLELLLILKQSRNFPEDVTVHDVALKINIEKRQPYEQYHGAVNLLGVTRKK